MSPNYPNLSVAVKTFEGENISIEIDIIPIVKQLRSDFFTSIKKTNFRFQLPHYVVIN